MPHLLIIVNVLLMTVGQLLFKQTAIFSNNHPELTFLNKFILNPWFYLAGISFALATIVYIKILTTLQLSIAYPTITTLAYVLTITGSIYFFSEKVTALNVVGIFLIILGITIASIK